MHPIINTFSLVRVTTPEQQPPASPQAIDLALLDMNFGYPNLGHDSLVFAVGALALELHDLLAAGGLTLRVLSYDVRKSGMLPELPDGRFQLYLGTGGPGHIDPRCNDGKASWSQGVREDPSWEPVAQRLFAAILEHADAAMLAVCHSFGLLCRWLGAATPTLRGPAKGGKSKGIKTVELTEEGCTHPWFRRFLGEEAGGRRASVTDSRLFDLIPDGRPLPAGMTAIAHEVLPDGRRGDALTMLELARDRGGVMPRFFAVNHHPEIHDPELQLRLVGARVAAGGVSEEWREERTRAIKELLNPETAQRLELTSRLTLLDPLRFHVYRQVRRRLEQLGQPCPLHEDQVLAVPEPR
jgi:hypothetical protein